MVTMVQNKSLDATRGTDSMICFFYPFSLVILFRAADAGFYPNCYRGRAGVHPEPLASLSLKFKVTILLKFLIPFLARLYDGPEKSNMLKLKKTQANRKIFQKHTK